MSINITSTSDRIATDLPTSFSTQEEGTQRYEGMSAAMAALADPAVIAKLANEFFAALPGAAAPRDAGVSSASPKEVDLRAIPGAAPRAAAPDYPREVFSFPAAPNPRSVPGVPQPPSSPPTGALNEADFRAIAASLAGATALVPHVSAAAPPPSVPSSSPSSVDGGKGGPWAAAPQIPPGAEMFSFPGVPAMASSPPTAPPSGSDLAAVPASPPAGAPGDSANAGRTDPWAEAPHFAELNDVFSFPRVPGVSVPGVPEADAAQPSLPASQPILGTTPAVPGAAPPTNLPESAPAVPKSAPSFAISETTADSADAEKAALLAAAPKFPAVSEMFSFPGVPGAQSPPGVPVLPSSIPAKPSETDLRALPSALAGASASASQVPGVPPPAVPGSSANIPDAEKLASFEFRPDLEPAELGVAKRPLDPRLIRQDFPILQERVHGRPLIWLDNAATTQKPNAVIDRLSYFYRHENSNVHRAAHRLAARATDAYESAREKTRRFLNASSTREIIFVRGTTEGINLVAQAWGRRNVQKDDEVVITWLEHHANIVPWQQLCSEKGARLRVAPVNDRGEVILEDYEKLLSPRTRIVSFSHVSNALGTITPAREMVEMAHRRGARVLVDGAQAVSHLRVDVQALDCDFYVFSGHKIFGPTGIGAVYGKADLLDTMPPWQGGGNMIVDVTFEKTTYQTAPARFEAGTGNIADAVGLGAALDYVEQIGMESIATYEHELLTYATAGLRTVPGLRLIGTAREKTSVLSFVLDDVRTEDVGLALNQEGIAVRAGHHCAQPILRRMGVEATVRPSLAFYNTCEEIDALVAALQRIQAGRGHRGF
jgi:cysteine desulfurase/selenocysteine lyase